MLQWISCMSTFSHKYYLYHRMLEKHLWIGNYNLGLCAVWRVIYDVPDRIRDMMIVLLVEILLASSCRIVLYVPQ